MILLPCLERKHLDELLTGWLALRSDTPILLPSRADIPFNDILIKDILSAKEGSSGV